MACDWVLEYLYRDASNYKVFGEAYIAGMLTPSEQIALSESLIDGVYFVPEQLGLRSLRVELIDEFGESDDDHIWHEWLLLRPSVSEERKIAIQITIADLLRLQVLEPRPLDFDQLLKYY